LRELRNLGHDDEFVHKLIQGPKPFKINGRIVQFAPTIPGYVPSLHKEVPREGDVILDITIAGDVEKNPGPNGVQSKKGKTKANNNKTVIKTPVKLPAAMSIVRRRNNPNITSNQDVLRVRFSEYVTQLTTSGTAGGFKLDDAYVYPTGLTWLGGLAANYSKYRFRSLEFEYVPNCSASTAGRVGMALSYDPADRDPANMANVLARSHNVTGPLWSPLRIKVDVSKFQTPICYVASIAQITSLVSDIGATPTTAAQLNSCNTLILRSPVVCNIATDGGPASTGVGSVMIHYDIELIDPVPSASQY